MNAINMFILNGFQEAMSRWLEMLIGSIENLCCHDSSFLTFWILLSTSLA